MRSICNLQIAPQCIEKMFKLKVPWLKIILILGVTIYFLYMCFGQDGFIGVYILGNFVVPAFKGNGTFLTNVSKEEGSVEGYLISNPHCRIPDISIYHKSVKDLLRYWPPYECSPMPLTRVVGNRLILNESLIPLYSPETKSIMCCLYKITRTAKRDAKKPDNMYEISSCKRFYSSVDLEENMEYIMVKCFVKENLDINSISETDEAKEVYKELHFVVREAHSYKRNLMKHKTNETLNVLIIGIDSVSRMNFIRTMPKTANYLKNNGWIELKGYHVVGQNTFPNLVPMLTGFQDDDMLNKFVYNNNDLMDACPVIWKNFSDSGYLTGYFEDEPWISTFNYLKKGFYEKPTDLYSRPSILAAWKELKFKYMHSSKACVGNMSPSQRILNMLMDMVTILREYLLFGFSWVNTAHDDFNVPSMMDLTYRDFLNSLAEEGITERSVIFFVSDHGYRFGEFRKTLVGWLQARLPFNYVWLPEWFKTKYPRKYENLVTNCNRLTTSYDVHMTLHDILNNGAAPDYKPAGCPKCMSLFDEISWDRSCEDAGIPLDWCACVEYQTLSKENTQIQNMVKSALNKLNSILQAANGVTLENTRCAKLSAKRILNIREPKGLEKGKYLNYIILFETLPGGAMFETTVQRVSFTSFNVGKITRINRYENQSYCIDDVNLRNYCYCISVT